MQQVRACAMFTVAVREMYNRYYRKNQGYYDRAIDLFLKNRNVLSWLQNSAILLMLNLLTMKVIIINTTLTHTLLRRVA